MSSIAYCAEIVPDPRLRRLVARSGALLGLVGVLVVLQLPIDLWIRLGACAIWVVTAVNEHRRLRRGWADCRALRFGADGEIAVLGVGGTWRPAQYVSGGILLGKIGWIRLRDQRGPAFGELFTGDARESPDWRRLQVIWRHVGP